MKDASSGRHKTRLTVFTKFRSNERPREGDESTLSSTSPHDLAYLLRWTTLIPRVRIHISGTNRLIAVIRRKALIVAIHMIPTDTSIERLCTKTLMDEIMIPRMKNVDAVTNEQNTERLRKAKDDVLCIWVF